MQVGIKNNIVRLSSVRWALLLPVICLLCLVSCGQKGVKATVEAEKDSIVDAPKSVIEEIDFQQDIRLLNMQELRLLHSFIYARYGVLLEESDLRDYWRKKTVWYDTLSRSQTLKNDKQSIEAPLSKTEQQFAEWIKDLMTVQRQSNFLVSPDGRVANVVNIVNLFHYSEMIDQPLMDELAMHGYAVIPDTLPQLFQIYQQNDTLNLPNFVTSDLFLQLSHLYASYMLQTVEQERLIPLLTDICHSLYRASMAQAAKEKKDADAALRNAAFFAIPYSLLTNQSVKVGEEYQAKMEEELAYIAQQTDHISALLPIKTPFPYSAFQPTGHYSRSADLRRFYKALKWLQTAAFCPNNATQRKQTQMLSALLRADNQLLLSYRRFLQSVSFLKGQAATASIDEPKAPHPTLPHPTACADAVYVIPPPFLADEEILRHTADPSPNAERPFPEIRDIFAAYGSQAALNPENSLHNKWMECLIALLSPTPEENKAWSEKTFATAAASWVKLKHDMLVYGEKPEYAEPTDSIRAVNDSLPPALTLGYVEQNTLFWKKLLEWIQLTESRLLQYQLMTPALQERTTRLTRYIAIVENLAEKQAWHEQPDKEAYRFVSHIGDSIARLSLSMVQPPVERWQWTKGSDHRTFVEEAIFERTNSEESSVKYAAAGNVQQIYIAVEINGLLYLTRGAAFGYTEERRNE
ncbi:hypothetical protein FACS189430_06000 [Bacteroidia bacterium]|nr:hypothetical protein FACS189430_06000 [Bacteroidia bacterium]